nr:hypothetical protein [Tanacetum cinerariifolium]
MVKNLDSATKFLMLPRFVQVFLNNQLEEMANHTRIYASPSHTKKIFENMKRVGKGFSGRDTPLFPTMVAVNEEINDSLERATITANSLDAEQDTGNISKTQSKETPNEPSSLGTSSGGGPRRQDTMGIPLLRLETTKTAQAKEIANLKKRVKRLERKKKSRSHWLKRLYKVGLCARVVTSVDEESLGEEDGSKQGRISDIDANQDIYLVNVYRDEDIFGVNDPDDTSMFDANKDLQGEEVVVEKEVAALIEIKTSRPKAKGIVMQEPSETPTPTLIVSSQQPLKVQDKDEQERIVKEKARQIDEVNLAWDDIQAKVDADYELAEILQAKEQEQLTDAEKAKLFMKFMEKRRKFFAAKRAEEKRNKPPTKAQQRSLMLMESTKKDKAEIIQTSSSKRARDELEQESSKKHKIKDENESTELKRCLEIVLDDGDEVTIDATPLSTKSPTIVDYKIYKEWRKSFF